MLLGLKPTDYDYAFSGPDEDFIALNPEARKLGHGPAYQLGKHEFTRLENDDIMNDLERRDFTLNSFLLEEDGTLHMHRSALTDLKNGHLAPASPSAMSDDPLRIFRAARLAAVYPSLSPTEECLRQMREAATLPSFEELAAERVGSECHKAMLGEKPGNFLRLLGESDTLHFWFRELEGSSSIPAGPVKYHKTDVLEHIARVMDKVVEEYSCWTESNAPHSGIEAEADAEPGPEAGADTEIEPETKASTEPELEQEDTRLLCVWMALCHDLGKVNTPSDVLPHHYQHEVRGMHAASSLAKRLKLSERMRVAGILSAKLHMKAGIYHMLRPSTKVDMLVEAHSKRLLLPLFLLAQADSGNPTLMKSASEDLLAILQVKLAPKWQDMGKESGKKLRELRCQKLAALRAVTPKVNPE
ncbi:HD domain-containing protein [Desulfovibrio sp. OttesenSCG-928-C06]|nr:HD domain-containing protein [Desulfovibrio sp. OttesenSCG-928-C06]